MCATGKVYPKFLLQMDDAITVALRVRPLSSSELGRGCQSCIDCVPNEPQVVLRNADKAFTYNYVFSPESSQAEVYDKAVKKLVNKLFNGVFYLT